MKPSNTRQLAILHRCQPSYSEWRLSKNKRLLKMSQKQLQQGQKRILVVDDEPDLTMICSLALQYHGFKAIHLMTHRKRYQSLSLVHMSLLFLIFKCPK
jgi:hypothetical protein